MAPREVGGELEGVARLSLNATQCSLSSNAWQTSDDKSGVTELESMAELSASQDSQPSESLRAFQTLRKACGVSSFPMPALAQAENEASGFG